VEEPQGQSVKRLFMMCGMPFAGKTTLAARLSARLGAGRIGLDEINAERSLPDGGTGLPVEEWERTRRIALARLDEMMRTGRDVVLDDTCCFRWLRDGYREVAERNGYESFVVFLDIPLEELERRRADNDLRGRREQMKDEVFEAVRRSFEVPQADENTLRFGRGDDLDRWLERRGGREMAGKLCPKVILEGTRLTWKTEIAFALNRHPGFVGPRKYAYHSPLVSGEWCGFTNFPWGRGLINFDPAEEGRAMETYATWVRLFELLRYYSWIVDRFHLSTRVWQSRHRGKDYDFDWLEQRLDALGFRLVLCVRAPESFEEARRERLRVSGNPAQYDDLGVFVQEQEAFRRLVAASRLKTLELDVTGLDPAGAADRITAWLETTGGLHASEPA